MKKLMIAAAIVCAAAFTQAASVTWSITGVEDPGEGSTITAYAFLLPTSSGDGSYWTVDQVKSAILSCVEAGENINDPYDWDGVVYGMIAGGSGGTDALSGDWGAGDTVYGAVVLFDADYPADAKNIMVLETGALSGFEATPDLPFNVDASSGEWKAVPEPTSGLLLLLGVAGLALRRRRA